MDIYIYIYLLSYISSYILVSCKPLKTQLGSITQLFLISFLLYIFDIHIYIYIYIYVYTYILHLFYPLVGELLPLETCFL